MTNMNRRKRVNIGYIVAWVLILGTLVTLIAMLTLQIAGAAHFNIFVFLTVLFGGIIAIFLTIGLLGRESTGRAEQLEGTPEATIHVTLRDEERERMKDLTRRLEHDLRHGTGEDKR